MVRKNCILILLGLLLAGSVGCKTTESYFENRIDKGIVFEGAWQKTGIIIDMPGNNLETGSMTLGREIGWGIMSAQPMGERDAFFYEHTDNARAGVAATEGTVTSKTTVRCEKQGYLGPLQEENQ